MTAQFWGLSYNASQLTEIMCLMHAMYILPALVHGIPYTKMLRVKRNNSNSVSAELQFDNMMEQFSENGYSRTLFHQQRQ